MESLIPEGQKARKVRYLPAHDSTYLTYAPRALGQEYQESGQNLRTQVCVEDKIQKVSLPYGS